MALGAAQRRAGIEIGQRSVIGHAQYLAVLAPALAQPRQQQGRQLVAVIAQQVHRLFHPALFQQLRGALALQLFRRLQKAQPRAHAAAGLRLPRYPALRLHLLQQAAHVAAGAEQQVGQLLQRDRLGLAGEVMMEFLVLLGEPRGHKRKFPD